MLGIFLKISVSYIVARFIAYFILGIVLEGLWVGVIIV